MSQSISFWRKVIYVVAIALLLFPLFLIGRPASRDGGGGVLAQLRQEHGLSQANLGEIDPASESMKLATLGMRGVAANLLWQKAFDYKMREEWDNFSATTNQITKLQPNYIMIWEFQAHNLAYNISVEFDDYRHRYHWVKKGVSFLIDGTHYNREDPRLLHYTGWIVGQKIGRADEHVQFREMFREDDDFHDELNTAFLNTKYSVDDAAGWDGRPDNWLVSRLWYLRAEDSVDHGATWQGKNEQLYDDDPLRGKSPLIFHNDAPMAFVNYASTIEEEGIHGDTAREAWRKADRGWKEFGQRPIPTSWGHVIRLGEYDNVREEITRLHERLDEMAPGMREEIKNEKIAALPQELQDALNTPDEELNQETYMQQYEAKERSRPSHREVAERADEDVREKAIRLAARLEDQGLLSTRIAHYRGIINYDYWAIRCEAEQTKSAVDARECIYKARKSEDKVEPEEACKMYEQAWGLWREVYDKYPRLKDDIEAGELVKSIKRYRRLLQALDKDLPEDFVLRDLLEGKREFADLYGSDEHDHEGESDATESDSSKPDATEEESAKPESEAAKPDSTEAESAKPEADAAEPDAMEEESESVDTPSGDDSPSADATSEAATETDSEP